MRNTFNTHFAKFFFFKYFFKYFLKYSRPAWLVVLGPLILPACAVVGPQVEQSPPQAHEEPAMAQTSADGNYWWYVPVKITWPEDEPIAWNVDVLLAHQLFKPILIEHAQEIQLWRFHRRAARDKAGHRFRFLFYARKQTAMAILDELAQNPLIPELIAAKVIDKIYLYERNNAPESAVEATSDKNWSLPMQRAWPYFAMGVSQVWLGLIDQYVAAQGQNLENLQQDTDVQALAQFYQTINQELETTWEKEGGHALLHHLNALFGYGDVAVWERRMMRF
jgi:hypothetical protein